jgi:deoxyinosine 3'endonuclease (endonuclease V)
MNNNYTAIIELQNECAKKVITHDCLNNFDTVSGIDVSYKGFNVFCSAVIINKITLNQLR